MILQSCSGLSGGRSILRLPRLPLVTLILVSCGGSANTISVASKNFTESVILGEIVAQQLEQYGYDVDRRLNLGGTFVCHEAIKAGQVDVYVEYTGTAYSAILQLPPERRSERVWQVVDSVYAGRWDLAWTEPFGFNNTFAMLVRGSDARRLRITTLTQAAPHARGWRPGFGYEFIERADGYRGLVETYDLEFAAQPMVMDLGLTYRALADGRVDIIAGNSTDGQIDALDLVHLADDRGHFPPYEAAPVVRAETVREHPRVREALRALGGTIDEATMRRLNHLVDVERKDVREVAREFVRSLGR